MSWSEYVQRFRKNEFDQAVGAIGKMSVQFQNLEFMLKSCISYFINRDDDAYGAIVTEKLPYRELPRVFSNLIEYHAQKHEISVDMERVRGTVAACNQIGHDRNRFVHSVYYPSEEGPMRLKLDLKPGKQPSSPAPISVTEIQKLITRIIGARMSLSALFYWYFPEAKGQIAADET